MGKPGLGRITSSPGSTRARIVKKMIGLAPGVTTTSSAATGIPRVSAMWAAMTRRSSGGPADPLPSYPPPRATAGLGRGPAGGFLDGVGRGPSGCPPPPSRLGGWLRDRTPPGHQRRVPLVSGRDRAPAASLLERSPLSRPRPARGRRELVRRRRLLRVARQGDREPIPPAD